MGFSDHFSSVSTAYAQFRPRYPDALFAFLASVAPSRRLAWDCATGTGQAATALGELFERVVATDASATQIQAAHPHPRVQYRVASAEASGLRAQSVDLITVAQALHWFELEGFYTEASRVLAPGGSIAAWSYGPMQVEDASVQRAIDHFYHDVVGPYWPPERQIVEEGYRSLPFPFEEISAPEFEIRAQMSAEQLEGYVRTWSATQRFISEQGDDPVAQLDLGSIAGASPCVVRWPVAMRVGRICGITA